MASLADNEQRRSEVRAELLSINEAHENERFPEEVLAHFNDLQKELKDLDSTIEELEARREIIARLGSEKQHVDEETTRTARGKRVGSRVPDDPTRFDDYRNMGHGSLEELAQSRRDGARMILETSFRTAHPSISKEEAQNDIDQLIDRDDEVANRVIFTASPGYRRDFEMYCKTGSVGQELMRTASLTTTAGGFAVPVELDTTLILTNGGVVNPIRQVARVRQTNVNTYEFINSTGISAGFGAEATEASDNAPSLQQPTVNIEKAFAFVPMSIEIAEDWAGIQQDLAICFADAKNQLESNKFLTGLGHASHEPVGLIAPLGNTAIVTSGTTAAISLNDIYSLENTLSPRFRENAVFFGNRAAFQKVRAFATALGPSAWTDSLRVGNPNTLIGYPAYEWSSYSSAVTTTGSTVLTLGDPNFFGIVDRVGMNVEFIQHLFGGSNRYPTGQRGLYCWWRTSSNVLSQSSNSSTSAFQSLKLL